jgi:hypothetical protein
MNKRHYVEAARSSCQLLADKWEDGAPVAVLDQWLAQASRWSIEDIHNLWNIDLLSTDFTDLWLPYEKMAIEYDFPNDLLNPLEERQRIDPHIEAGPARVALIIARGDDSSQQGFRVMSFWRSTQPGRSHWVFAPSYVYVDRSHLMNLDAWMKDDSMGLCTELDPKPHVPMIKGLIYPFEKNLALGYTPTQMASDLVDDIKLILSIMAMLSCSNIEVVSEEPSKWLNAKRKKKGKPPLPRYHAITLHNTKASAKAHREAAEEERTHASPRPHWRRGHPRTYASGKRVWVRPCRIRGGDGHLPEYELI